MSVIISQQESKENLLKPHPKNHKSRKYTTDVSNYTRIFQVATYKKVIKYFNAANLCSGAKINKVYLTISHLNSRSSRKDKVIRTESVAVESNLIRSCKLLFVTINAYYFRYRHNITVHLSL